jgi:hypothetical protein
MRGRQGEGQDCDCIPVNLLVLLWVVVLWVTYVVQVDVDSSKVV